MPEPTIPINRGAGARRDKQTAAQIDAHIHSRAGAVKYRLDARPVVHRSTAHIDARINSLSKTLRTERPEAPGG